MDEYWVECFALNEALKLMAHGFQIQVGYIEIVQTRLAVI